MIESGYTYGEAFKESMEKGHLGSFEVDYESGRSRRVSLVFGQMNEPPGAH